MTCKYINQPQVPLSFALFTLMNNAHKLSTLIKKGIFLLTVIWIRGTTETRWCVTEAARLQVIMLTAPLTLHASYLPLPPFSSSPFSHSLPLSPSACYPAHGIQGCFKTTSFDKNYWHFNFAINPSCSYFSSLLFSRTFFAIPHAEKMHPLFSASQRSKIFPLSLFPLLQFFTFLNELCQLLYWRY